MEPMKKLGVALIGVNLTGLVSAIGFTLVGDIFAGLIGFLIGLIGSSILVYDKESR
jgi:sensor histidine kinase regulating citrate/malate metabolism